MKYGLMVVAALFALLVASPVQALTQDEAQQMVTSVGCKAPVTMIESKDFNAYYDRSNHELYTVGFENLPETWQRFILWHEVGHCLQAQEGRVDALNARGTYETEWDADYFAIKKLAEEGIDGAALNETIWADLYRQYGYEGDVDDSHGTSVDRQTRGNLNRRIGRVEA